MGGGLLQGNKGRGGGCVGYKKTRDGVGGMSGVCYKATREGAGWGGWDGWGLLQEVGGMGGGWYKGTREGVGREQGWGGVGALY